jgi:uncharacterized Zn finger protein
MGQSIQLQCDACGQMSECATNFHVDQLGKRIEWPKATVNADGIYFTIRCPNCGEREQRLSQQADID